MGDSRVKQQMFYLLMCKNKSTRLRLLWIYKVLFFTPVLSRVYNFYKF